MSTHLQEGEVVTGLPRSEIHAIECDRSGVLWIACPYGEGILAYDREELRCFDRLNSSLPTPSARVIFADRENRIWFVSGGLVFTYDRERFLRRGQLREEVTHVTQDASGRLWFCDDHGRVVACYRDEEPDGAFTALVQAKGVRGVQRSSDGALWTLVAESPASTRARIVRFDGAHWEDGPWDPVEDCGTLRFDATRGVLYASTRRGLLRSEGRSLRRFSPRLFGLDTEHAWIILLDRTDNLWLQWQPPGERSPRLGRYDGERVVDFSLETPLEPDRTPQILADEQGRIWFAQHRSGLVMLDAKGWTVFPIVPRRKQMPWQLADDYELFMQPTVRPDLDRLFDDPRSFHGRKISLVGRVEARFEYLNLTLEGRQGSGIWPDRARVVCAPEPAACEADTIHDSTRAFEYVGFLDYRGGYGHMAGWPYRFMITEVYRHGCTDEERAAQRERCRAVLEPRHRDAAEIMRIVERWIGAMGRGDEEALAQLRDPPVRPIQLPPHITARLDRYYRLEYERVHITTKDDTATARFIGGVGRSISPSDRSVYEVRELALVKVDGAWKIHRVESCNMGPEEHVRKSRRRRRPRSARPGAGAPVRGGGPAAARSRIRGDGSERDARPPLVAAPPQVPLHTRDRLLPAR